MGNDCKVCTRCKKEINVANEEWEHFSVCRDESGTFLTFDLKCVEPHNGTGIGRLRETTYNLCSGCGKALVNLIYYPYKDTREKVMERWVSISDRLPEYDSYILVVNGGLVMEGCYNENDGNDYFSSIGDYRTLKKVTHWSPLPKPPESEVE